MAAAPVWQKWGVGSLYGATGKMLLEMEAGVFWHDLIQNVRQLEFANVPLNGWIIDPDVHGHSGVVHLPAHCGEIVHTDMMLTNVTMVIYGGKGPKMFFHPFAKSP